MIQLTLVETDEPLTAARQIDLLSARWSSQLGDPSHADEAARVTARRFADWGDAELSGRDAGRVAAYFRAVLRSRILRMSDPAAARARRRLVAESIAADLRGAGWDEDRASDEARRVMGESARYGGVA